MSHPPQTPRLEQIRRDLQQLQQELDAHFKFLHIPGQAFGCEDALPGWYRRCAELANRMDSLEPSGPCLNCLESQYVDLLIRLGELQEACQLSREAA